MENSRGGTVLLRPVSVLSKSTRTPGINNVLGNSFLPVCMQGHHYIQPYTCTHVSVRRQHTVIDSYVTMWVSHRRTIGLILTHIYY